MMNLAVHPRLLGDLDLHRYRLRYELGCATSGSSLSSSESSGEGTTNTYLPEAALFTIPIMSNVFKPTGEGTMTF